MSEANQNKILLEETFYVLTKKNCVFKVQLLNTGICLIKEHENSVKEQIIPICDIIGCRCLRSKKTQKSCLSHSIKVVDENSGELDHSDISSYLYIYAYLLRSLNGSPKKRNRTIITLRFRSFDTFDDNHKEAQRWRSIIKRLTNGESVTTAQIFKFSLSNRYKENKRLLVLCNPKSGPGRGKNIFQEKVAPILQEAEIPFDLHVTKYANYAREFVRDNNLFQWTGILLVGGDGIVFEVINGLFERWDWTKVVKEIPLGVVPGGSGNGLARSIAYHSSEPYLPSTLPSALAAVRNQTCPMDLVRVETKSQIMFSFLSVGWGFLSDVDIESERLRILGGQRFNIWSVARLIGLRSYKGKLWYIPADVPLSTPKTGISSPNLNLGSNLDIPSDLVLETQGGRQRLDSWYSAASRNTAFFSTTESSYQSTGDSGCGETPIRKSNPRMYGPASQLPCLTSPLTSAKSWVCKEGRFIMVHASYQSHLGEDCLFAPEARLNDGHIWLLVVHHSATRAQLLQCLLGFSSGSHVNGMSEGGPIEMFPVNAFRIEPDMSEKGYMTVDGEHVEYGPIQAEIFPELGNVMVP